MRFRPMRIGVTIDLKADALAVGMSAEDAAEFDSEATVEAVCASLAALGYEPVRIGNVRRLIEALSCGNRWDGVFNLCEGLSGISREAQAPAVLEAYGVPYVFSDPLTCALTLDKAMAKRVARDCGVPTPDFAVVETPADVARVALPYPVFLKPLAEGSGKGVGEHSRADAAAALKAQAEYLLERFRQPVLVETFLSGREFTVGITGTGVDAEVLGLCEIIPLANYAGDGYGLVNKSDGWEDKVAFDYAPTGETAEGAKAVALAAWRVLRCRDGGRVDIRCDGAGRPNFIEVNPLAGIRPAYSDLCLIANHAGLSYTDLIGKIMASFRRRHPELG
jgi:D-alanine-D-alanine ligase